MAKDTPIIKWDDHNCTGFGGFRVVKYLENFIPPADWEVDPDDPSHFLPKYPPCRYRRLTQGTHQGRPFVKIHCLLFEDIVSMETCRDCTDVQPPIEVVQVEFPTNEEEAKKFHAQRRVKLEEIKNAGDVDIQDIMGTTDLSGMSPDDDTVFSSNQPGSEYIKKPNDPKKQSTQWAPCPYREQRDDSDCACTKFVCKCPECPLFNKQLRKKDCRTCQHRPT